MSGKSIAFWPFFYLFIQILPSILYKLVILCRLCGGGLFAGGEQNEVFAMILVIWAKSHVKSIDFARLVVNLGEIACKKYRFCPMGWILGEIE